VALIRDIHADTLAALTSGAFHPVTLAFVDWPEDPVRVHSGFGTLTWGGHDWMGVGLLDGLLSLPAEGTGAAMVEGEAVIGGDPDGIDSILNAAEAARGATVQAWCGVVTTRSGTVLIGEPFGVFTGSIGAVGDSDEWTGADVLRAVTLGLETGPSQRSRASAAHSYEDQKRYDSTDTAGRWVKQAIADFAAGIPKW